MRKHVLEGFIARAGSVASLARLLGVRPETVRTWQRTGVTKGGEKLLAELTERQKLERAEAKGKRQTFDLLFKLAGERGDLRKARTRDGVRAGPRTSGYQWVKAFGSMLTAGLVAEIDAWLLSHRRRFNYWQAVAVATEYTKQRFKGYKTVLRQVTGQGPAVDEASGDFAVEEQIATSRSNKLSDVRGELAAKLEEAMDEGALVYIHEVTLFNYRLRTEEERIAWESGKRSARRKRAKRKSRRAAGQGGEKKPKSTPAKPVKEKTWEAKPSTSKKSSKKSVKKTAKKAVKKSSTKATRATVKRSKTSLKSTTRGASRSKSASTRSPATRSSSKRASVKASRPKTSVLHSQLTKSKKSTKKQKSSSTQAKKTQISKTQAPAKKTTAKTTAKKTTAKKTRTSKATKLPRGRK